MINGSEPTETRQLHKVAPHLAYADHPASSSRAANPESFSVCATPRNASVPRVRLPHPCEANTHAPMYSKSPYIERTGELSHKRFMQHSGKVSIAEP